MKESDYLMFLCVQHINFKSVRTKLFEYSSNEEIVIEVRFAFSERKEKFQSFLNTVLFLEKKQAPRKSEVDHNLCLKFWKVVQSF